MSRFSICPEFALLQRQGGPCPRPQSTLSPLDRPCRRRQQRQQQSLLVQLARYHDTMSVTRSIMRRHGRSFSSSSQLPGERLRIAIVGGGVAGLSTALHLADLVDRGLWHHQLMSLLTR
jgi:hypothetical protein